MLNKKKTALFISFLLLTPSFVFSTSALRPGTADYLVANGLTKAQLTTDLATDAREAFLAAVGETTVSDPVADVLSRTGTYPKINYGWGDIVETKISKDVNRQCWSVDIVMAEEIPVSNSVHVNFLIFMDGDNDTTNNAPNGVRSGMDKEFNLKNSQTNWAVDYRWYNSKPNALTWAVNKETAATFSFDSQKINVCVPFAEVAETLTPTWRIGATIFDGTNTQLDLAPGPGFPPPPGETYATWSTANDSTNPSGLLNWNALMTVLGLVILGAVVKMVFWIIEKKK